MPTAVTMVLPKSRSADEFELICKDVLSEKYNKNFVRYGRQGQKQSGIDLFFVDEDGMCVVAQCKNYFNPNTANMLISSIKKDIEATKKSGFRVKKFIAITSMDRDANVQSALEHICCDEIIFWDDIQSALCNNENLLKTHYPNVYQAPQQNDLTFWGRLSSPNGLYRLALVKGKAFRVFTREANSYYGRHLLYDLNITNKNDFSVKLNEICLDIKEFEEVSDFLIISSIIECGGPVETNYFHGIVDTKSKAKLYPLRYLGYDCLTNGLVKANQYLRLEPKQSEHAVLVMEFNSEVSGFYRFSINVSYIVDGVAKSFKTDVCNYLHIVRSDEKSRNFFVGDEPYQAYEKIISIWESESISDDEYNLLAYLAGSQRDSSFFGT